jgi:hypothetical protein
MIPRCTGAGCDHVLCIEQRRVLEALERVTCPTHGDPLVCIACEQEEDQHPVWKREATARVREAETRIADMSERTAMSDDLTARLDEVSDFYQEPGDILRLVALIEEASTAITAERQAREQIEQELAAREQEHHEAIERYARRVNVAETAREQAEQERDRARDVSEERRLALELRVQQIEGLKQERDRLREALKLAAPKVYAMQYPQDHAPVREASRVCVCGAIDCPYDGD